MLIHSEQFQADKDTAVTVEAYHNRAEVWVTKWTGETFDTLAHINSFSHDTTGEVIFSALCRAGFDDVTALELAEGNGYPLFYDEEED